MMAKREERAAARSLRSTGLSLGEIAAHLGVAKSSVSTWVRDVPLSPEARASGVGGHKPLLRPAEAEPTRRLFVWGCGRVQRCSKCGLTLPLEAFNRLGDGRQFYCRECFRAYFAARGDNHRRQSSDALHERRRRARQHVYDILRARPCADCDERDPVVLEFDHVRGKEDGLSVLIASGKPIHQIDREIARCDVVCVNCHRRRTAERAGWLRISDWRGILGPRSHAVARNLKYTYSHLERSGCTDCGGCDLVALEFDHEGDKRWNVMAAAWSGVPLSLLQREVATCAVRCGNCHRRRTAAVERSFRWRTGLLPDVADSPRLAEPP